MTGTIKHRPLGPFEHQAASAYFIKIDDRLHIYLSNKFEQADGELRPNDQVEAKDGFQSIQTEAVPSEFDRIQGKVEAVASQ